MRVQLTPAFRDQAARLSGSQREALDEAVCHLAVNALVGVSRAGLGGVRVYRLRLAGEPAVLAYEVRGQPPRLVLHGVASRPAAGCLPPGRV